MHSYEYRLNPTIIIQCSLDIPNGTVEYSVLNNDHVAQENLSNDLIGLIEAYDNCSQVEANFRALPILVKVTKWMSNFDLDRKSDEQVKSDMLDMQSETQRDMEEAS